MTPESAGYVEPLIPYITGPASSVFVLLMVLVGVWLLFTKHLIPLAKEVATRHLGQIDAMIAGHREDARHIVAGLAAIEHRLTTTGLPNTRVVNFNESALSPDRST